MQFKWHLDQHGLEQIIDCSQQSAGDYEGYELGKVVLPEIIAHLQ